MLIIANPIYDAIFKFMMLDEKAAKCLLSAVLDRKIEVLEVLPQEQFELEVRRPVIRVGRQYIDSVTKEEVQGTDAFIEALTHDAYFVQIPLLPEKQKTRVERVLSVFSQHWKVEPSAFNENDTRLLLQIPDELKNEDNAPLLDRLSLAVADPELKRRAIDEESFDEVLRREFGVEFEKGLEEGLEKGKIDIARHLKALGMSIQQIAQVTQLSEKAIEKL